MKRIFATELRAIRLAAAILVAFGVATMASRSVSGQQCLG